MATKKQIQAAAAIRRKEAADKKKQETTEKKKAAAELRKKQRADAKKKSDAAKNPGPTENFAKIPTSQSSRSVQRPAPTTKLVCKVPTGPDKNPCGSVYFSQDKMTGHLRAMHMIGEKEGRKWTGRPDAGRGLSGG